MSPRPPSPRSAQRPSESMAVDAGLGVALLLSLACGESARPVVDAIRLERGPVALELAADPNGLYWDDSAQALYVTDDDGNRILEWTDERGFFTFERLPEAPSEGAALGQLVRTADDAIVVTRSPPSLESPSADGTPSDVVVVRSGDAVIVPGLDGARHRIGLTRAGDGSLYDAWSAVEPSGEAAGVVSELSLEGFEREVISGLCAPIGVLAVGEDLFVSECDRIGRAARSDPASYDTFALVERPGLLAAGPEGSLFAAGAGGNVYRIDRAGQASTFEAGLREVRGVAYDAGERRLFVAEHDPSDAEGRREHALHILPVD